MGDLENQNVLIVHEQSVSKVGETKQNERVVCGDCAQCAEIGKGGGIAGMGGIWRI